jgi:mRNA turnover protein 4
MRNTFLKAIRQDWTGSRLLYGRTRVMNKVLGATPEEEYLENLHHLTKYMNGDIGLLLTNEKPEVVKEYFDTFVKEDFARAGIESPITFTVPAGIVYSTGGQVSQEEDVPLAHSLEATVRSLGMPTQLKHGKVELSSEYTVCSVGQTLNSKQTRLLKLFGVACSQFKFNLLAYYDKSNGETVAV